MSAEWCQIDPKILIHHKAGVPVESHIEFFGMTILENLEAMGRPHGIINAKGDLEVRLVAPDFPWAYEIKTKWNNKQYCTLTVGNKTTPLKAGENMIVTIPLPKV